MIDIGKGVSVDFRDNPYVFGIEGWDPIRIQKGKGRIVGVSLEQLEVIVNFLKKREKRGKNEQGPNNADVKSTSTGKTRTVSGRGSRS